MVRELLVTMIVSIKYAKSVFWPEGFEFVSKHRYLRPS